MTNEAQDIYLTTRQVAEALGLSIKSIERQRHDGSGPPYIKLSAGASGRVRYRRQDMEAWLAARLHTSPQTGALAAGASAATTRPRSNAV